MAETPTPTPPAAAARDADATPLPALYERLRGTGLVRRLLELARDEDLGPIDADLTGLATADPAAPPQAVTLAARQPGVAAGLAAVPDLLDVFAAGAVSFTPRLADGDRFESGDVLATFTGPIADLVRTERTVLNLVARLSGIATRTARFVDAMHAAKESRAALYDTRKTTPGLRAFEKYAVRCGGGRNHRMGLYDAVMFKDNHLAGVPTDRLAGHARGLIDRARAAAASLGVAPAFIEFEVDTLDQLDALLTVDGIDVVLLDNMPPVELVEAVARRDAARPGLLLEASGGVTLETVGGIAATGVDRVSVGGLTHQAVSLDLGFDHAPA